jgi:hypothetical protein
VGHQVSFFVTQAGRLDLEAVIRAAGEICLRVGKSSACEPIELATVPWWHPVPVRCERAA